MFNIFIYILSNWRNMWSNAVCWISWQQLLSAANPETHRQLSLDHCDPEANVNTWWFSGRFCRYKERLSSGGFMHHPVSLSMKTNFIETWNNVVKQERLDSQTFMVPRGSILMTLVILWQNLNLSTSLVNNKIPAKLMTFLTASALLYVEDKHL